MYQDKQQFKSALSGRQYQGGLQHYGRSSLRPPMTVFPVPTHLVDLVVDMTGGKVLVMYLMGQLVSGVVASVRRPRDSACECLAMWELYRLLTVSTSW